MSFTREDVARSIENHFTTHAQFVGLAENLIPTDLERGTDHLDYWWEIHQANLYPDSTREADQLMRGTLRVLCKARKQPFETVASLYTKRTSEMTDKVETVLRGADIEVRDYTANGGVTLTGICSCDEVQVDDLGEADGHVRTVICTTKIIVSAALAAVE